MELAARFINILNHPQYAGGYLSDVAPIASSAATSSQVHNFTIPSASTFDQPSQAFSSNPRSITLAAKFIF